MMKKLGDFIVKRRWWILLTWVLAAIIISVFAPSLSSIQSNNQNDFIPNKYESIQASKIAKQLSTQSEAPTDIVVFSSQSGGVLSSQQLGKINAIVKDLNTKQINKVQAVTTSQQQIAPSKKVQLATVVYSGSQNDESTMNAVPGVRQAVQNAVKGTDLKAGITGSMATSYDMQDSAKNAEKIVGIVTILLVLLLPAFIFRSPFAGLLPLVAVGIVFSLSERLIALAGHMFNFQVDQQLSILYTVVLYGIGTDYILFLLFRYRERLRGGDHTRGAVSFALSRAGEAIFSAALVVLTSFVALFFADFGIFSSLAPGLVICVAVMMLAAMTLVPALLAVVGEKVFWPSKAWMVAAEKPTISLKVGRMVSKRPGTVSALVVVLLLILTGFASQYQADFSSFSQPPKGTESAQAYDTLSSAFPAGVLAPTEVYVTSDHPLDQQLIGQMQTKLAATNGVSAAFPSGISKDGKTASLSVVLKDDPYSAAAIDTVNNSLHQAAHSFGNDKVSVYVGGVTAAMADIQAVTNRDLRVIFPIAAAFIFVILAVLLRSLVAPVVLLLCVSLGYAATLGITVLIFQDLLDYTGLISFIPLFMYIFVVAIGTDYNILTITRLREELLEGNSPHKSAALTVEHSSATVASAGLILAATFASLLLGGISFLLQMGSSIAIGVSLAAFVIAPFLIPSLAAKLGYAIWWPGHRFEKAKKR